mmetsp:Transcript_14435/g.54469  ORF Transcript_14435/g.54469 Transcript_14435/m.54469 type:complete len:202 (-) Transcript_14435:4095-4700(-)
MGREGPQGRAQSQGELPLRSPPGEQDGPHGREGAARRGRHGGGRAEGDRRIARPGRHGGRLGFSGPRADRLRRGRRLGSAQRAAQRRIVHPRENRRGRDPPAPDPAPELGLEDGQGAQQRGREANFGDAARAHERSRRGAPRGSSRDPRSRGREWRWERHRGNRRFPHSREGRKGPSRKDTNGRGLGGAVQEVLRAHGIRS